MISFTFSTLPSCDFFKLKQKQPHWREKKGTLPLPLKLAGFTVAALAADAVFSEGTVSRHLSGNRLLWLTTLAEDIGIVVEKDPATNSRLEAALVTPGLHAIWSHRLAHRLYKNNVPLLPRIISAISRLFTNIEIHPGATLGKRLFIDHTGAIIGETAVIGDDVEIIGRTVLGGSGKDKGKKRHPTLLNNVVLGMNTSLIGSITIGNNVTIGAEGVVTRDVPDGLTIVGNPAMVLREADGSPLSPPIPLKRYLLTKQAKPSQETPNPKS